MNTKKFLAAVSALVMAGSALPFNATASAEKFNVTAMKSSAEEAQPEPVVFTAESYGDYIKITGFTGSADVAFIPADVAGVPVTTIGKLTPDGSLGKLVIPESVTSIEDGAFDEITNFSEIEINPENPVYTSADGVLYNKDMTQLLVYPYAKKNPSFTIPDSVTSISETAFKSCIYLSDLTFGNGIKSLSVKELSSCYKLTSVGIPASVETIEDGAFDSLYKLESVNVADENTAYCSVDGILYSKYMTQLIKYPPRKKGTAYVVPEGVTSISEKAFRNTQLIALTLPETVETIGKASFAGMTSLATIVFGNGAQEICEGAFEDCTSLSTIVIGSVQSIKADAFKNCSSLGTISIPADTADIDLSAFNGCTSLKKINVSSDNESYSSIDGVLFDKNAKKLLKYTLGRTDEAYIIPDSVVTVDNGAFENCSALKSITFGATLTDIETIPLTGCTSFTDYAVSEENADYSAIDGVLYSKDGSVLLKYPYGRTAGEYTIPDSFASFDVNAFSDNYAITAFSTSETNESFTSVDGVLFSKDEKILVKYPAGNESDFYEIPENAETINGASFEKAKNIEGISFTSDDTVIEPGAFTKTDSVIVLYGNYNSTADIYAEYNGFEFIALDGEYAFGDVNDDKAVDALDASSVLSVYALTSTGHRDKYIEAQRSAADIDRDGIINAIDASRILSYYAYAATTQDEIISIEEYYYPIEETTEAPTEEATKAPTEEATEAPTEEATEAPTEEATEAPTEEATEAPTEETTVLTVKIAY